MIITDYVINEQKVGYEIADDGYDICLNGKPWISQHEPYIPYPNLGYEGSCLKQIEELCNPSPQKTTDSIVDRVTSLEDMIIEMSEILYA